MEIRGGHMFVRVGDGLFLLDTGAPNGFGSISHGGFNPVSSGAAFTMVRVIPICRAYCQSRCGRAGRNSVAII